jgi:hypothetical protein
MRNLIKRIDLHQTLAALFLTPGKVHGGLSSLRASNLRLATLISALFPHNSGLHWLSSG